MVYLASSGDEAKIWDGTTLTLLEQFNPFDGSISDLTWSHDGNSLASCCNTDTTVHLRSTKAGQSVPLESFTVPAFCQCLDYSSSSRFILCGCVDGSVHIWDRKSKTIKKSCTTVKQQPVNVARWNWNDTYVAIGLANGNILLYNVVTGQINSPLVAPSSIRQLKYNPYHKSSLVSVSDDGVVNFWDTNARQLVHSFTKTHMAPARDLAFSPINDYLMVTVGLDKRAVFYDIQNKICVRTVVAEQPLTSVDIMPDGATVVVGTTRGKMLLYDMRKPSTPVSSLTAHKSSVKRLTFVNKAGEKGDSAALHNSRRKLPTPPLSSAIDHSQNNNVSNNLSTPHRAADTGLEIFSPVTANKSSNSVLGDHTSSEQSWMHLMNKTQPDDILATGNSIFSPLRPNNSQSINSTNNRSSFMNKSFLTQVLDSVENNNRDQVGLQNIDEVEMPDSQINSLMLSNGVRNSTPVRENSLLRTQAGRPMDVAESQKLSEEKGVLDVASLGKAPTHRHITPVPSSAAAFQLEPARLQEGGSFQVEPASDIVNGRVASHSPRTADLMAATLLDMSVPVAARDGPVILSPSRSRVYNGELIKSTSTSTTEPPSPPRLSASSSLHSMRHWVQECLKEQLLEHQNQLKAEIRLMLGQPSFHPSSGHPVSAALQRSGPGTTPGMFQAEFIRNLIREELEELKEFIHSEFWCVQVELIKQVFQLQKQINAGFAECSINPLLLDEIDRLREENARLKKQF